MTWEDVLEQLKKMNFEPEELYEFLKALNKLREPEE